MVENFQKNNIELLTENRENKFREVIAKRQLNLTVILEDVHDPHNLGAVMRSCDAVGIAEIYVVFSDKEKYERGVEIGFNSNSGSKKWVEVHLFNDSPSCIKAVRKKYDHIYGTHLSEEASSLYDLELTGSVALLFGNEQLGVRQETLSLIDGNFIIPQYGMVQSLNISVACAVSLFECSRQRTLADQYKGEYDGNNSQHSEMFERFVIRHKPRKEKKIFSKNSSRLL